MNGKINHNQILCRKRELSTISMLARFIYVKWTSLIRVLTRKRLMCSLACLRNKFFLYLFSILLLIYVLQSFQTDEHDYLIEKLHSRNVKTIQLLTNLFTGDKWDSKELGEWPFRNCPVKSCYAFKPFKYKQKPLEKSDAVLVHMPNVLSPHWRHNYNRDRAQIWILYTCEPPKRSYCSNYYSAEDLDDWFNLTITYRPDSDMPLCYRPFTDWKMTPYHKQYIEPFKKYFDIIKKGSKWTWAPKRSSGHGQKSSVIWLVGNCWTTSKREDYVNELMKHISIDVYGKCKNIQNVLKDPCKDQFKVPFKDESNIECLRNLYWGHKFYLAFENSLCNDYITEKYWKLYLSYNYYEYIWDLDIIPVVRGGHDEQYRRLSYDPGRKTYINADDFASPKDLADYLTYLDTNNTAFMEYFTWKRELNQLFVDAIVSNFSQHQVITYETEKEHLFCDICAKIHDQEYLKSNENKVVKVSEWFRPERECWDQPLWLPLRIWAYFMRFFGICMD